jgi:hypothetical protein
MIALLFSPACDAILQDRTPEHLSCVKYNLLLEIQTQTKLLSQQIQKDKESCRQAGLDAGSYQVWGNSTGTYNALLGDNLSRTTNHYNFQSIAA